MENFSLPNHRKKCLPFADYCEHDMYVDISRKGKTLAVPLSLIKPLNAEEDTEEAVDDWHYWISQWYMF